MDLAPVSFAFRKAGISKDLSAREIESSLQLGLLAACIDFDITAFRAQTHAQVLIYDNVWK